ncbi:MAG: hypothetical protein AAF493_10820 [Pseudomonadota bacterium]
MYFDWYREFDELGRVFVSLDGISISEGCTDSSAAECAYEGLRAALVLPSAEELPANAGATFALHLLVSRAEFGCPLSRSRLLPTVLGFGNARLSVHARVIELPFRRPFFARTFNFRHAGLSRRADTALVDNSESLLHELATVAAIRVLRALRQALLRELVIERYRESGVASLIWHRRPPGERR